MTRSFRRGAVITTVTLAWCAVGAQATTGQWSKQSIPSPEGGGEVYGISCPSSSNCVAVGRRFTNSAGPIGLTEFWNGSNWSYASVPKPTGAQLNGVSCPSSTSCMAVGYNVDSGHALVESWNGTAWKVVPNAERTDDGQLMGVSCVSKADCTAVGVYLAPGHGNHALLERWDGKHWKLQQLAGTISHHQSQLGGVSCLSRSFCVAVGSDGTQRPPLIERWNGSRWASESNGHSTDNFLVAVSCASTKSCAAVGRTKIGHAKAPFAERWNGKTWSIESSASPSGTSGELNAVSCASSAACIAVGNGPLAERWNGSSWSLQTVTAPANMGAGLFGVSCPSTSLCFAIGGYIPTTTNSFPKPLAEMWTK